jgi:hypothetical protein
MDMVNLRRYEHLSAFEIQDELIRLARARRSRQNWVAMITDINLAPRNTSGKVQLGAPAAAVPECRGYRQWQIDPDQCCRDWRTVKASREDPERP